MQGLGNANTNHFWKAIKNLTSNSYLTIPTLNYLGKTADTDISKANMISGHFLQKIQLLHASQNCVLNLDPNNRPTDLPCVQDEIFGTSTEP